MDERKEKEVREKRIKENEYQWKGRKERREEQ